MASDELITSRDLNRLAVELNPITKSLDSDAWAERERISPDALRTLVKVFWQKVTEEQEKEFEFSLVVVNAFYYGWEAHKQYGRYNNDASIAGGS